MDTSKKIAVIGTGPAGITCALELKDNGFEDVTLFGEFGEAQCRTLDIDGVVADVGTCYVHTGYWNTVKPLVDRYGFNFNYLPGPSMVDSNLEAPVVSPKEKLLTLLGLLKFIGLSMSYLFTYRNRSSRLYGISMQDYLSAKGLDTFSRSFILGPGGIAQGYGFLDEVTAYGAFRWFRPSIFFTPLASRFQRGTACIREGYGTLFNRILSDMNARDEKITSVTPVPGENVVEITTATGDTERFDHVVVACRLDGVESPVTPLLDEDTINSTAFFSFLWTSDDKPWFDDRVYFVDHIDARARHKILTYRSYGKTTGGKYVYWGAGYTTPDMDKKTLQSILEEQIQQECKVNISDVHFYNIFDYNLRFSKEAIQAGKHLQISNLQGAENVWYSGGMLSHWDIDSIVEHNRWLVSRLVRKETPQTLTNRFKLGWRELSQRLQEI